MEVPLDVVVILVRLDWVVNVVLKETKVHPVCPVFLLRKENVVMPDLVENRDHKEMKDPGVSQESLELKDSKVHKDLLEVREPKEVKVSQVQREVLDPPEHQVTQVRKDPSGLLVSLDKKDFVETRDQMVLQVSLEQLDDLDHKDQSVHLAAMDQRVAKENKELRVLLEIKVFLDVLVTPESTVLPVQMDLREKEVPTDLEAQPDPRDHQAHQETEENKDLLDLVERLDWVDQEDLQETLEMRVKMVSLEWPVHPEHQETSELVDLQVCQERLVLMENQEHLVFPVALERRVPRECKEHQAQRENRVHLVYLDLQEHQDPLVNVEKEEILDRKEFLDHKDKEELLEQLVLRERKERSDPKEIRVSRATMDCPVCLAFQGLRVCLVHKECLEKMDPKALVVMLDPVETQEWMENPENSVHLVPWDHVVCPVTKDPKVTLDLQVLQDLQDPQETREASMLPNSPRSLETKTKDQDRLMIPPEKCRPINSRVTKCWLASPLWPPPSRRAASPAAPPTTQAAPAPTSPATTPPSPTACTGSILTWALLAMPSMFGATSKIRRHACLQAPTRPRRRGGTADSASTSGSPRRSRVDSHSPSKLTRSS